MSHGSVNNVARSHSNNFTNVCNQFIPQVVTNPIIRDEVRPAHHGRHPRRLPRRAVRLAKDKGKWTWEYNSLLLATDPVAMDHVEWDIVDAKRRAGEAGPRRRRRASSRPTRWATRASTSASPSTSPWPAPWAWATSTTSRPAAGEYSIQHKVVNV